MLATIPYTTFPTIDLGFIELRTFGLMVALGMLVGAWVAGRYVQSRGGPDREDMYRMATRLVIAGIVGSRLTWVVTHLDQIESPLDLIAVWKGGLQFSGGFAGAILFGMPFFRRWERRPRWIALDGLSMGLALGLAIGRIGCYSVGEHFGSFSTFVLAVRYDGGEVREPTIGDVPLLPGMTFHNTALYEFLYALVIFAVLAVLARRRARTGTMIAFFCALYGIARFVTDFARVNDNTLLGLTGAQYLSIALVGAAVWIFVRVRPAVAALPETTPAADRDEDDDDEDDRAAVAGTSASGGSDRGRDHDDEDDTGEVADEAPGDAGDSVVDAAGVDVAAGSDGGAGAGD